jgi:hypothetical protein
MNVKHLKHLMLSAGILALGAGLQNAAAQAPEKAPAKTNAQAPEQAPQFPNFDPKQMMQMIQKQVLDNLREQMDVKDDTEWQVIEPRLTKVFETKAAIMMGGMRGMMGRRFGGPGGPGGGPGGPGGGFGDLIPADPTADAVQKTLDSHAPDDQIKAALAKHLAARKKKQDELAKDAEALRQVLTLRQEAILVSAGMLE